MIRELARTGWSPGTEIQAHVRGGPLQFDNEKAVMRKSYFRCLLSLDMLWVSGCERVATQQHEAYYAALLAVQDKKAVRPGCLVSVYTALMDGADAAVLADRSTLLALEAPTEPPTRGAAACQAGSDEEILPAVGLPWAAALPGGEPRASLRTDVLAAGRGSLDDEGAGGVLTDADEPSSSSSSSTCSSGTNSEQVVNDLFAGVVGDVGRPPGMPTELEGRRVQFERHLEDGRSYERIYVSCPLTTCQHRDASGKGLPCVKKRNLGAA